MPQNTIVIRIDFPALDRLLDFLEASEQAAIDAMEASVVDATARLQQSADGLSSAVTKEQT